MTCKSKKGKDCELLLRNISVDCIKGPIPWTLCWFMLFWAKSAHFRVRPCLLGYSFYFLLKVWRRKTFSSAECKKVKCPNLLEKIPWNFLLNFVGILSEILQLYSCAALWKSEKPPRLQSVGQNGRLAAVQCPCFLFAAHFNRFDFGQSQVQSIYQALLSTQLNMEIGLISIFKYYYEWQKPFPATNRWFFFEKFQIAPFLAKSIAYVGQKVDSFLIVWPHCI